VALSLLVLDLTGSALGVDAAIAVKIFRYWRSHRSAGTLIVKNLS
jgi:hypothetical protein